MKTSYKLHKIQRSLERRIAPKSSQQKYTYLLQYKKQYPNVYSISDTIKKLVNTEKSISRFGDGELFICLGVGIEFQKHDKQLQKRLIEILKSNNESCLIGLVDYIIEGMTPFTENFWYENIKFIVQLLADKDYCNTNVTRQATLSEFEQIKTIWKNQNILFITGKGSRFDINHELFDNIKSHVTIYGKSENAWDNYDALLTETIEESKKIENPLVICSLGPTATVLAYDLSTKHQIRALDLGHMTNIYDRVVYGKEKPENIRYAKE